MYQELAVGKSVPATASFTCATQASCAWGVASILVLPTFRMASMQPVIHSTCCSMATGMFVSTDGLCGPVMVNRLGKPATATPR